MTIKQAASNQPGVHTYYVHSDSGADYVVTHVRRAGMRFWSCSCPDFLFRRQMKGSHRHCKHVNQVIAEFKNRKLSPRRAA
jgi:predicted nucleic acid-binding Zn finger protein